MKSIHLDMPGFAEALSQNPKTDKSRINQRLSLFSSCLALPSAIISS